MPLYSDCCGEAVSIYNNRDICPKCKKYCDFVKTESPQWKHHLIQMKPDYEQTVSKYYE